MKFTPKALLKLFDRRLSYRSLFLDETGNIKQSAKAAMADLKRFCNVDGTSIRVSQKSGTIDPYAMAVAEGRREVWLRLQYYLKLDEQQLLKLDEEQTYDN